MTTKRIMDLQLCDQRDRRHIILSGGKAIITQAGQLAKATLYDKDTGASISNPVSLTNGYLAFAVDDTVLKVDMYIQAPAGQFIVMKDVKVGSLGEVYVDTSIAYTVYSIPFSMTDGVVGENDTGIDLPLNCMVLPNTAVRVDTIDAETLDVGLLSSETNGDANGFLAAVSTATAQLVKGTLVNGGQTLGALVSVDEGGTGELVPEGHIVVGANAVSVTWTPSAGSDTMEGVILLPVLLGMSSVV